MSLEENKAVVRRFYEDAPCNPAACDEIFAPHFLFLAIQQAGVTPQVVECTPESEKAAYEQIKAIWGGWNMSVEEMIAEGDRVMVRWIFRGVHQGEFHGLAPSGKPVTYAGINIFRIVDGRIAEVWDLFDRLWMWQQLGVLPEMREALARVVKASA
jgi:hypothetical protein